MNWSRGSVPYNPVRSLFSNGKLSLQMVIFVNFLRFLAVLGTVTCCLVISRFVSFFESDCPAASYQCVL